MPRGEKTGTLFDYPTYTLKNLAKEYNIHYYIKDIERLSKADLVEALMAHMEWLKSSEKVKNKLDFEKSLADAPTNYEKDERGFFKLVEGEKPGRKNIKQIEKEREKKDEKPPTPPTPPAYKGQKGVSKAVAALVDKAIRQSPAAILEQYRSLTAQEQIQFRDAIGIEAKPLPKGVPALGEVLEGIKEFKEDVAPVAPIPKDPEPAAAPAPKRKIKIKSSQVKDDEHPKLTEFEAKAANDGPLSSRRYLIALAKLLIANKKESQSSLGRKLAEMGFSGTTQSTISKKISYMKELGLVKPFNSENGWFPLIA